MNVRAVTSPLALPVQRRSGHGPCPLGAKMFHRGWGGGRAQVKRRPAPSAPHAVAGRGKGALKKAAPLPPVEKKRS